MSLRLLSFGDFFLFSVLGGELIMKRDGRKTRFFTILFGITSLILALTLGLSVFVIFKLNRRNMYSKSIMLDNNYFLNLPENSRGTDDSGDKLNAHSKYEHLYGGTYEIPAEVADDEVADRDLSLMYNDDQNKIGRAHV